MDKLGTLAAILGLLTFAAGCGQPVQSNAGAMAMAPEPHIDVDDFAADIDDTAAVDQDSAGAADSGLAAPQIIGPVVDRNLNKSVAVINDEHHPVSWDVIETARETMLAAGCHSVGPDHCDVLIECRQRPQLGTPTTESPYGYARATYLQPPDPVHYARPQWIDDPAAHRLATVDIVFDVWDEDSGQWTVLREIVIRVGEQGVHSDVFNRADLQALRETMDAWASYYLAR